LFDTISRNYPLKTPWCFCPSTKHENPVCIPVRDMGGFLKPLPEDPLFFLASAMGETAAPHPF